MKNRAAKKPALPNAALIPVAPFPLHAINAPDYPHDLGPAQTPEEMARHVPPGGAWREITITDAAAKALAALVGSGPTQTPPHFATAEHLREGLARLRDHALAGDAAALRWYGRVISEAVADLGEMARRHPELVREWSRKQNVVPVLTGLNKGHRDELAANLAAFAVGDASPYRVNPRGKKVPDISTPANRLAGMLCAHLSLYRFAVEIMRPPVPTWASMASKLPELSARGAWKQWGDAAWECLFSATGGEPEKWSDLGDDRSEEGTGAVRSLIKTRLRRAIRDLSSS